MAPAGFEPVKGKQFTFQTKPAVRGMEPFTAGAGGDTEQTSRLPWQSGDESNVGYGSPLNTVVA